VEIKILGSGCAKCNALEQATKEAVAELGLDVEVQHVTDMEEIMRYGVMSTPALVVDDQVRLAGRIPKVDDIISLLSRA
jgi:small redox-active disulfide protein 2